MLTSKAVNIYGFISLAIMVLMLVLILFKQVPESLNVTLFVIAAVLFLGRIALRVMLARQDRLRRSGQDATSAESTTNEKPGR